MKFGIFDHLERRKDVGLAQQYQERLKLVAQADIAGFHCYHVAEHHHSPLCLAPNQAVYLAAVAQCTKRLLFGPLVYVLPLHHPVRLLEEISMVDHLSDGRFQIGIGRGTGGGQEFAMWGGNPEENNERFDETFEILMRGMTNDFLSYDGKFYQFRDLWMELRPKQTPHPPLWYAGNPVHAAEYGGNFICFGAVKDLPGLARSYLESWERHNREADPALPHVEQPLYGGRTSFYLAETDREAEERARKSYQAYSGNFAKPIPPVLRPNPVRRDPGTSIRPEPPISTPSLYGSASSPVRRKRLENTSSDMWRTADAITWLRRFNGETSPTKKRRGRWRPSPPKLCPVSPTPSQPQSPPELERKEICPEKESRSTLKV